MIFEKISSKISVKIIHLPYSNTGTLNKLRNILWLFRVEGNIHVTGDVYYAILLSRQRFIATIHDIGVLSEVSRLKKWIIKFFWFDIPAKKAKKLIFVSNHARNDFLTRVKAEISKTRVIYNPLPEGFQYLPRTFNTQNPVILHLGTKTNKNLIRLCEALNGIPCTLIVVGKLNEFQTKSLEENKIDFKNKFNVSDEEIKDLYLSSDMLCFVSTHEGFGMPIIEAQAIGRPVITSNISSMPEIAGTGACLVDPYDVMEIRRSVLKVIRDGNYREELIKSGLENVKRFDPNVIAGQYLEVYTEVFGRA